jgi:hypothetical protein
LINRCFMVCLNLLGTSTTNRVGLSTAPLRSSADAAEVRTPISEAERSFAIPVWRGCTRIFLGLIGQDNTTSHVARMTHHVSRSSCCVFDDEAWVKENEVMTLLRGWHVWNKELCLSRSADEFITPSKYLAEKRRLIASGPSRFGWYRHGGRSLR